MYLILAWRNIWRNPRRTIVILLAVIIGVWSMIFLGSLMRGMETEMVRNSISFLTGSIQIHHRNYRNDPVVDHSMDNIEKLEKAILAINDPGALWTKRVRVNAIVSNARHSGGVSLVGIEPEKEAKISFIGKSLISGRFLLEDDKNKIIVGKAFLKKFNTKIGNKLILMSQDTQNEIASRAFRIVGIFSTESEAIEKQFVFVPISQAAGMLKMGNSISEISILLPILDINCRKETLAAKKIIDALDDDTFAVETWQQVLPMIKAYLEMSGFFLYIWYFVVFIAMGFGIVNTTLMAIFERMREFGLMKALGMRPFQVIKGVVTEAFFLLVLGILAGNIMGFLSVAAIAKKGIDLSALAAGTEMWGIPRKLFPEIWVQDVVVAGLVVLVLGILVSLYPALKAARVTPTQAMTKN
ncbi:MAG: ABC transporter permease [Desulfobacula sp.]|jgi:ABC-type lipoprotein release transport system permease subunit|uniref:ABC transporter permease n=1 Tax=Desulfobacula sp. TaxID=2593537 RepID=UPI001D654DE6|nr:ABC transporter permease [Desulfobacula sp.]MBT3485133.1 ABC transporter permease [Desulfobacula sp.]MBT3804122.1 ABC transporter permease [Desulfobacula sp.]MBT4025337.1 ABC transporter permease [Desulfobacula sp.]MBT4199509.1 ABC transporter permease [Desulfobacula sp.]